MLRGVLRTKQYYKFRLDFWKVREYIRKLPRLPMKLHTKGRKKKTNTVEVYQ
jgi:hypothetical protein